MTAELDKLAASAALQETMAELRRSGALNRQRAIQECTANPAAPSLTQAQLFFGEKMTVDLRETVSQQLYLVGSFEQWFSRFLLLALKEGMVFFDVGAHFGYFSLLGRHCVGERGAVVAFEPTPLTLVRLQQNVRPFPNVTVVKSAAWHENGKIKLHDFGVGWSAFNSVGGMRIDERIARAPVSTIEVPAVSLDSYCDGGGPKPDVVKIDAESAELRVLQGMEQLLTWHRPIVTVEIGDFEHLQRDGQIPSTRAILAHLQKRAYRLFEAHSNGISGHKIDPDRRYGYDNMIAVPEERVDALPRNLFAPDDGRC